MPGARKTAETRFPLWSLLWRMLLFGPVLMPLGVVLLALGFVALFGPYFFGALMLLQERYALTMLMFSVAILWTPLACRFLKWLLRGIEDASL
jgi:hypothetical protein